MKKVLFTSALLGAGILAANAQVKIGNNPTTVNQGSVLELESATKGLRLPQVSLSATGTWGLDGTQSAGMTVYNTNNAMTGTVANPTLPGVIGVYYWDGTRWVGVASTKVQWPYHTDDKVIGTAGNGKGIVSIPGVDLVASGGYSHAEGYKDTATGLASWAIGSGVRTDGWYSFGMGLNNKVTGNHSVAFGDNNKALSPAGTITGTNSTIAASSDNSAIIGGTQNNIAGAGLAVIAGGSLNQIATASGGWSFIGGGIYDTINGSSNAIAAGQYNRIDGSYNLSSGYGNKILNSLSKNNFVSGEAHYLNNASHNIVGGSLDTIIGGANNNFVIGGKNVLSGVYAQHNSVSGQLNKVFGSASVISGYNNQFGTVMSPPYVATNSIVIGADNVVNTWNNNNNTSVSTGTYVFGAANTTKADYGLTAGRYLNNTGTDNILLGYGASTGAANRSGVVMITDASGYTAPQTAASNNSFTGRFANGYRLFTNSSNGTGSVGVALAANGTSWATISDRRSKENIKSINYGLKTVMALNPTQYNYIGAKNTTLGFIAQEVQEVVPEVVEQTSMGENQDYLGVKYSELIPVLTKAIQEQQSQIEELKAEIKALKAQK